MNLVSSDHHNDIAFGYRFCSASLWLSHGKSSQEAMDTVLGAVFMREMCSAQHGMVRTLVLGKFAHDFT